MKPHAFSRRVLLCVTGLSPQVVTETLYALAVEPAEEAFVPTEVRLVSTADGAEQARLALLAEDRDHFGRLCREYGLPAIRFDESTITVIQGADGRPLRDILTPADNEAAADTITQLVATLTADADCAVHASIAGGRKTMGFFLGYALSLYGRPQDRLSHVLVSEGFEGHRDFFYKPRDPVTLRDERNRREISTASAEIRLATIPFIRLSAGLHEPLLSRSAGYGETVRVFSEALGPARLRVEPRRRVLCWAGREVPLKPTECAVYAWLAYRRRAGLPDVAREALDRGTALHTEFRQTTAELFGEMDAAAERVDRQFARDGRPVADADEWFAPHISRINRAIERAYGRAARDRIGIRAHGRRLDRRYGLAIDPDRIDFA